jgi:hypothetical protein
MKNFGNGLLCRFFFLLNRTKSGFFLSFLFFFLLLLFLCTRFALTLRKTDKCMFGVFLLFHFSISYVLCKKELVSRPFGPKDEEKREVEVDGNHTKKLKKD